MGHGRYRSSLRVKTWTLVMAEPEACKGSSVMGPDANDSPTDDRPLGQGRNERQGDLRPWGFEKKRSMSTFPILDAPWRPKGKGSSSNPSSVWHAGLCLKSEDALQGRADVRDARVHIFKMQGFGSGDGYANYESVWYGMATIRGSLGFQRRLYELFRI